MGELIGKSAVRSAAIGKTVARGESAKAEEEEGKKYILHGMYAECSMGTMKNYLNTDVGHGVVYQGQPLLNANDHAPQTNLTHFGDCNSKMIYEEAKKQADEKYKAEAGDGFFARAGKAIAKNVTKAVVGVQECFAVNKCKLDTPLPWRFCNEEHMIDGAPALTIDSVCPCKFGGIISIIDTPDPEPEPEAETEAAEAAEAEQAYVDMMSASYGFDEAQSLLIQKAYELFVAKKGTGNVHDFVANMAGLCDSYGGKFIFGFVDGIPESEKAQKYFKKLGLSEVEVSDLTDAVNKQHIGELNTNAQEDKDFAHEMAVYAGYFNDSLHRVILDMGIIQFITGDLETLNSYKGDVYSTSMGYDDMNADIDAFNVYMSYTKGKDQDFFEVLTEYNKGILNSEINRAESFLENLGNGKADIGLENLKKDLDSAKLGEAYIGRNQEDSEIDKTKQKFLDYIEAVRIEGVGDNEKTQE